MGCHFLLQNSLSLLQGIFLTQGSNPGLPLCRQIFYPLSHREAPWILLGYFNHTDCRTYGKTSLFILHISQCNNFSSVWSLSCVRLFATPWITARRASLSITNSQSSPKPMSVELVMPPNHLILCRPLLLLPSIFPSITVFSIESALRIRWPKYWSFSFSISPSSEHPGLISFRNDWLDLLAVQGTLKNVLQHHSSKASILLCSAYLVVQLSHPYMTTGKTTALTRWTFVDKVMSLLFNMLFRSNSLVLFNSVCMIVRKINTLASTCMHRPTGMHTHTGTLVCL